MFLHHLSGGALSFPTLFFLSMGLNQCWYLARRSREAESRLKAYNPAENPAGQIPTLVEPNRQLERKGWGKARHHLKDGEETWLIQQKGEEKSTADKLLVDWAP